MKLFLVLWTVASFTLPSYALDTANWTGTVNEVFCGEISPMAMGDACIVLMTTNDQKKIGLLLDFDHWLTNYPASGAAPESLIGKKVSAKYCDMISEEEEYTLWALKDFNAGYVYFDCYADNVYVEQDEP